MRSDQFYQANIDFASHPLAPLFFNFIDILKTRGYHRMADDLLKISKQQYIADNRQIIAKIILEMMNIDREAANDNKD